MSRQDALIGWGMKYYHENINKETTLFAAKAEANAGDRELLRKLKEGMTFGNKGWSFDRWEFVKPSETPIVPISRWSSKKATPKSKLNAYLTLTTGVYKFTFKHAESEKIEVLYMLYEFGSKQDLLSLVILPFGQLNLWARFEGKLVAMKAPRVKPSTKMAYVIGSCSQDTFTPQHKLEDVILPDGIKEEMIEQIDYFFSDEGLAVYNEYKVPPFRKMLAWGIPGTGKSMLAQALAGDQMTKGRVVVFVAASDKYGASFSKIQSALDICSTSKFPVFMVVEEVEAYLAGDEGLSQVRNVLEGFESARNPKGSLLFMTSNQPHILDSALLRFGRIDYRREIPPIRDVDTADMMLKKYLGAFYPAGGIPQAAKLLTNIPPVFVRELAFTARMRAAATPGLDLTQALIDTIKELKEQATDQASMEKAVEAALKRAQPRENVFGFANMGGTDPF